MKNYVLISYVRDRDSFEGNEVARFDSEEEALKALLAKEEIAQKIREESIKMTSKSFQNTVLGYEIQMETYDEDGNPIEAEVLEASECGFWEALGALK